MPEHNPSQHSSAALFASRKHKLAERLSKLLQLPVRIQDPLPATMEDAVHALGSSLFETPMDINGSRLHIFVGREEARSVGVVLGVTASRAVEIVGREWAQFAAKSLSATRGQPLSGTMYEPATASGQALEKFSCRDDMELLLFASTVGHSDLSIGLALPRQVWEGKVEEGGRDMGEDTKGQQPQGTGEIARLTPTSNRNRRRANHRQVSIEPASFGELTLSGDTAQDREIDLVDDVKLPIIAEVGSADITLGDIMELETGSVIALDKMAGQPCDLFINGYAIAKAEVIVLDDNFGLRIQEIVPAEERIRHR